MLRKALVAALLLVLSVVARAQPAVPDFHDYQALLTKYITRIEAKGEPFDTRFDYEQLYVDEKIWTLKRSALLERMHAQLLDATPSAMTPAQRLAWSLNTYNFLVIEHLTLNLLIPRQQNRHFLFVRYKNVDQIFSRSGGFFDTPVAAVEGREYTLAGFERRFVFGDTTEGTGPRAPALDPRVRFAINPARTGNAPLPPFAFHPDSLDRQLDRVTRNALAMPRYVTVKANPPALIVSQLMARDRGDFGGTLEGMVVFLQKYVPRAAREIMKQARLTSVGRFTQPDLELNQKAHPKIIVSAPADSDSVSS